MLHLLYILAFTILAFLAVGNLIRNMMMLGSDSQRYYGNRGPVRGQFTPSGQGGMTTPGRVQAVSHPELLDEQGNVVDEPFLVMRSITVEDARERLDALYNSSPSVSDDKRSDA
jgi:hypothetical protein